MRGQFIGREQCIDWPALNPEAARGPPSILWMPVRIEALAMSNWACAIACC